MCSQGCSPAQALNNWGLVLQELAAMRPPAERAALVALSADKFRRAMALRPDFDRACYNLGTVVYAHACQMQSSTQQHLSSALTQVSLCDALACCKLSGVCKLGTEVYTHACQMQSSTQQHLSSALTQVGPEWSFRLL